MIEAFGTVEILIPNSLARRTRSVCVVALSHILIHKFQVHIQSRVHKPKWIPNYQERNIHILRIPQDLITFHLDHIPVRNNNFPSIIFLLL